jgi:phosphoserine phosphatase
MGGSVKFEDALTGRLNLMRPSREKLQAFLCERPPRLSPGIRELVSALQARKVGVFLVSGGFRAVIHPIAESLGIPLENVYANTILFDVSLFFVFVFLQRALEQNGKYRTAPRSPPPLSLSHKTPPHSNKTQPKTKPQDAGEYAGFDRDEFTSRSGGKPAAIRALRQKHALQRVVMVGDGATDLEARKEGAAALFIGYGGVVVRPNIAEAADWYVHRIADLTEALLAEEA